ncbi:hypothetical protein HPB50_000487 [Hyalomma asiaticum]|uniref:Uncharacterized protein n=1 Tax=Hyalomma asiaticum TaxID=266040 RepID=A0ACB7RMF2_HYAAI|nr:hypothetical protein HPB50_000487 [Hyalomma asiaticum]
MHNPYAATNIAFSEPGGIEQNPWSSNRSDHGHLPVPLTNQDGMRQTPLLTTGPLAIHSGVDTDYTYLNSGYGRSPWHTWQWTNEAPHNLGETATSAYLDDIPWHHTSARHHPEIIQEHGGPWSHADMPQVPGLPPSHYRNPPHAMRRPLSTARQRKQRAVHDPITSRLLPSAAPNAKSVGGTAATAAKGRERTPVSIKQQPTVDPARDANHEAAMTLATSERQSVAASGGGAIPAVAPPGIKKPTMDRTVTSTSPAAQIQVASQVQEPQGAPKPFGGFAGVANYVEEPNVIVFVPRPQPTGGRLGQPSTAPPTVRRHLHGAPGAGASVSPPFYSPTIPPPVRNVQGPPHAPPPSGGIPFTRMYFLCCIVVATFIVPFGIILFSYVTSARGKGPVVTSPRMFNYRLTPPLRQPTMSTSPPPSTTCVDRVSVADVQRAINATAQAPTPHGPRHANLFCIYNSSRVLKGPGRHFIPADLPLSYCTNIIYWSLAIKYGSVESRTPVFDRTAGLSKLRQLTDAAGHTDSTILAAIGGYPEDSPEFSLLGHDPRAMPRFTTTSASIVRTHRLNGTAIHWVAPDTRCQDPGDEATLIQIVMVQRHIFEINGYPAVIAVFLPPRSLYSSSLWRALEPIVDYAFVETEAMELGPSVFDLNACDDISQRASTLLSYLSTSPRDAHRICAGLSLAPWLAEGNAGRGLSNLSLSSAAQFPGAPGTVAVFEFCASPVCRLAQGARQCLALTQRALYGSRPTFPLYLFLDTENLNTVLSWGSARGPGPNGSCVVLYDVDLDSYDQPCRSFANWASLEHFKIVLAAVSVSSPLKGISPC